MDKVKWMVAGVLVGIIAVAFRDMRHGRWLSPAMPPRAPEPNGEEPVLGYDGMTQETLLEWLSGANLDTYSLERIIEYEEVNQGREPVLQLLQELLD